MKFGGTSMAGIERIRNVAERVRREAEAGNEVLVVVSAMAGSRHWDAAAPTPPPSPLPPGSRPTAATSTPT
jgi:aspartokinase